MQGRSISNEYRIFIPVDYPVCLGCNTTYTLSPSRRSAGSLHIPFHAMPCPSSIAVFLAFLVIFSPQLYYARRCLPGFPSLPPHAQTILGSSSPLLVSALGIYEVLWAGNMSSEAIVFKCQVLFSGSIIRGIHDRNGKLIKCVFTLMFLLLQIIFSLDNDKLIRCVFTLMFLLLQIIFSLDNDKLIRCVFTLMFLLLQIIFSLDNDKLIRCVFTLMFLLLQIIFSLDNAGVAFIIRIHTSQ